MAEIPALHELSERGREIVLAYVEAVGPAFIEMGRRQAEDEWRGRMEVSAAIARQIAERGPADALEMRRGRPERAERHRQLMRERGIA